MCLGKVGMEPSRGGVVTDAVIEIPSSYQVLMHLASPFNPFLFTCFRVFGLNSTTPFAAIDKRSHLCCFQTRIDHGLAAIDHSNEKMNPTIHMDVCLYTI
jgi:hypothetical protein